LGDAKVTQEESLVLARALDGLLAKEKAAGVHHI
jgi:hypothetical protein